VAKLSANNFGEARIAGSIGCAIPQLPDDRVVEADYDDIISMKDMF
jgi:hypothetical protein